MGARQIVLPTPSKPSHPRPLLSCQRSVPITPLAATLMILPASVTNKRLTPNLTPLESTLTKNRRVGAVFQSSNGFLRGSQPQTCKPFNLPTAFSSPDVQTLRLATLRRFFRPRAANSRRIILHSDPQHARVAHPRPSSCLRRLRPLHPLRPVPQRLSDLPPLESRSRFAPRPHPPDDQ